MIALTRSRRPPPPRSWAGCRRPLTRPGSAARPAVPGRRPLTRGHGLESAGVPRPGQRRRGDLPRPGLGHAGHPSPVQLHLLLGSPVRRLGHRGGMGGPVRRVRPGSALGHGRPRAHVARHAGQLRAALRTGAPPRHPPPVRRRWRSSRSASALSASGTTGWSPWTTWPPPGRSAPSCWRCPRDAAGRRPSAAAFALPSPSGTRRPSCCCCRRCYGCCGSGRTRQPGPRTSAAAAS
jgi:hypothetical protein